MIKVKKYILQINKININQHKLIIIELFTKIMVLSYLPLILILSLSSLHSPLLSISSPFASSSFLCSPYEKKPTFSFCSSLNEPQDVAEPFQND